MIIEIIKPIKAIKSSILVICSRNVVFLIISKSPYCIIHSGIPPAFMSSGPAKQVSTCRKCSEKSYILLRLSRQIKLYKIIPSIYLCLICQSNLITLYSLVLRHSIWILILWIWIFLLLRFSQSYPSAFNLPLLQPWKVNFSGLPNCIDQP